MSMPTNSFATYESKGNREDLSDIIYRIDPIDTPFVSGVAKVKATGVNHEWQTQALAAAAANAVIEGDDATTDAVTPTVRLGNICQISDKVARVTGTQQAIKKAGRKNEKAYQIMLKSLELKRDMEFVLLQNTAKVTGDDTTARKLATVLSWIKTNTDKDAGGSNPATSDGLAIRTDSATQRYFNEAQLKTVLQSIWTNGGDPDVIQTGGFNKQLFSSFVGRGTPTQSAEKKKIYAAVDVYESDFGTLKIVPNRVGLRTRDALVFQMDMWALAYLRNMTTTQLAKTGDSDQTQILCEYTLEARNEKASGGVFDLKIS
jgi:hypothetical protein